MEGWSARSSNDQKRYCVEAGLIQPPFLAIWGLLDVYMCGQVGREAKRGDDGKDEEMRMER